MAYLHEDANVFTAVITQAAQKPSIPEAIDEKESRKFPTFPYEEVLFMSAITVNFPDRFIDNAKVMSNGQITIPKDVRAVLGLDTGSRVTFIVEKGSVRMVNSAVYAMQMIQAEMAGEGDKAGITSEGEVNSIVKEIRSEGE